MPSVFYNEFFRTDPPLTSLFVEYIASRLADLPEQDREQAYLKVVSEGLVACRLVEGRPSEDLAVSVAIRLGEATGQAGAKGGGGETQAGRFFAGYLTEWATKLNPEGLCCYLADYDYDRAYRYYCELDQQTLVAIAHDKLGLELERARVGFEAALFGFGGKYKGTPGEADKEFDLTKDSAAAEVALKNLGF
jgi:hypothetical protein